MYKFFLIFFLSFVIAGNISAQDKTFNCTFVEEKWIEALEETVISKGIISYEPSIRLICEYIEPEDIKLCKEINGNLFVTKNGKSVQANTMFCQMMDMMLLFINGDILKKTDEYNIEEQYDDNHYIISLKPKSKNRFSLIKAYYDKTNKRIKKTILKEPKGDTTTITIIEIKKI